MKPREIFNLGLRLLGLVFLYLGLSSVPTMLPIAVQLLFSFRIGEFILGPVLTVGWPLLVAYWLVRGAPLLMRIAYREAGGPSGAQQSVAGATQKSQA